MNPREVKTKIMDIFTSEDLFHKAFLRPCEFVLRTPKTDAGLLHQYDYGLPQGMMLAEKDCGNMSLNQYTPTPLNPCPPDYATRYDYRQLQANNEDNLISLLKKQKGTIDLAICVCMYSEDKRSLKTTLAGIGQNIDKLVANGTDPDKIAVVVVMDGIQHVHPTVTEYFEDLERESEIYLAEDSIEPEELFRQEKQDLDEDDAHLKKRNFFLFDIAQLEQRRANRFSNRKAEFQEIKNLKKEIEELQKKKHLLTYDVLNKRLQDFYIKNAKDQLREERGLTEKKLNELKVEEILEATTNNLSKSRALIDKALREAKRYCAEYLSSRDELAYVNAFRTSVFLEEENKTEYGSDFMENNDRKMKDTEKKGYHKLQEENELRKVKMNLFMCVKYRNSGKLSSHNWFINGFCHKSIFSPQYFILLDTGLRPAPDSIYKMYHYLQKNTHVGGVCGYMKLRLEKPEEEDLPDPSTIDWATKVMQKFADIQRAQQIEYHLAHLIDKPFESTFGFIHVLPGAFSGYSMKALIPDVKAGTKKNEELERSMKLLKNYFKGLDDKIKEQKPSKSEFSVCKAMSKVILPDMFYNCCYPPVENSEESLLYNENINLAEDRILCLGIHQHHYKLQFLPDAEAFVDPIKSTSGLLGQRKRWINGSFFAFEKVKREISQGEKCDCCVRIQIAYLSFMNALAFVAPALFLFTVSVAMQAFRSDVITQFFEDAIPFDSEIYNAFVIVISLIYVMLFGAFILFSLHLNNKNKRFVPLIYATSTIYGLFSLIVFTILTVDIIRGLIGDESFTIENQRFIDDIPGGQTTIDSLRFTILGILALYGIPILVYAIFYCTFSFVFEILFSIFAFIFYTPTYLILLTTYALCRIDDISWGTKGLDSDKASGKDAGILQSWKVIKFLYVAKLIFWNTVVGGALLHFGNDFVNRFFITFAIMVILAVTLAIKVFLSIIYYCGYNCKRIGKPKGNQRSVSDLLKEFSTFEPKIRKSIEEHIDVYLNEAQRSSKGGRISFGSMMVAPKNQNVSKIFQKQSQILSKNRSSIKKKDQPFKTRSNNRKDSSSTSNDNQHSSGNLKQGELNNDNPGMNKKTSIGAVFSNMFK